MRTTMQQTTGISTTSFCQKKKHSMISRISCILLLSSSSLTTTAAFAPQLPRSKRQSSAAADSTAATARSLRQQPFLLWLGGNDDFDDFSSQSVGNGDTPDTDGEALAKEFYQQLRDREQEQEKQERKQEQPQPTLSEQEARLLNRKAFSRRREVQAGKDDLPGATRKFTGNSNMPSSSAGLFTGRGSSVFSIPADTSPRQRMMQNELSLVGRAERTLLVQIVATLGLLFFALYIGWSGGIAANSASEWSSVADLDTSIEGMENVIPVPTDTETSVWL